MDCPACGENFVSRASQMPGKFKFSEDLDHVCSRCLTDIRDEKAVAHNSQSHSVRRHINWNS